jgi:hypothetical protein
MDCFSNSKDNGDEKEIGVVGDVACFLTYYFMALFTPNGALRNFIFINGQNTFHTINLNDITSKVL